MNAPRLFPDVRLHVVSGKGGAGKTTVAAALALALAAEGRRTLLMEVEGRQGIAQLFDSSPLPYEERRVARAPDGGEVRALAVVEERNRLARELHDSVKQHLFSLAMTASALRAHFAADAATLPADVQEMLHEIEFTDDRDARVEIPVRLHLRAAR